MSSRLARSRSSPRLLLCAALALVVVEGGGCRLFGDPSVPCATPQDGPSVDCDPGTHCGPNKICVVDGAEGEGEGAVGEGEGEGEGEGTVAEGEGEGAVGEGEGSVGEGEGEGAVVVGGQLAILDVIPAASVLDDNVAGVPSVFHTDASDCAGPCTTAPGPAGGLVVTSDLVAQPTGTVSLNGPFIAEAIFEVTAGTGPLVVVDGSAGTLTIDRNGPNFLEIVVSDNANNAKSAAVVKLIASTARGWAHVLCVVDSGSATPAEGLQCMLNGERIADEPTGRVPNVGNIVDVTTHTAVAAVRVWGVFAVGAVNTAAFGDALIAQDMVELTARTHLASYTGALASDGTPPFIFGVSDFEVFVGGSAAGSSSSIVSHSQGDAVFWLLPGWPRVIADDDDARAILLEGERDNRVTTDAFSECARQPLGGPSHLDDAFICAAQASHVLASSSGTNDAEGNIASVFAVGAGVMNLGSCRFDFTQGQATFAPPTGCALEKVAGPWFRLSARSPSGGDYNLSLSVDTLVALPQIERGSFATTPLAPQTHAHPDTLLYSGHDVGADAVGIAADVHALRTAGAATIVDVFDDDAPPADLELSLAGGVIVGETAQGSDDEQLTGDRFTAGARVGLAAGACADGCTFDLQPTTTGQHRGAVNVIVLGGGADPGVPSADPGAAAGGYALAPNVLLLRRASVRADPAPSPHRTDFAVTYGSLLAEAAAAPGTSSEVARPWIGLNPDGWSLSNLPAVPSPDGGGARVPSAPVVPSDQAQAPDANDVVLIEAMFEKTNNTAHIVGGGDVGISLDTVGGDILLTHNGGRSVVQFAGGNSVRDGWVLIACVMQGPNDVCAINMADASRGSTNQTPSVPNAYAVGPSPRGIAFAALWNFGPDALLDDVANAERARIARLFGVGPTTSPASTTTVFARGSLATVLAADPVPSTSLLHILAVSQQWPRVDRLSSTLPAGYVSETSATNLLLRTDFAAASWTRTGISASSAPSPCELGDAVGLAAGGSLSQAVQGAGSDPLTFSVFVQGDGALLSIGGAGGTFKGTTLCDANVTCANDDVGTPAGLLAPWRRERVTVTVPINGTAAILNTGAATLFLCAPQLEAGRHATSFMKSSTAQGTRGNDDLRYENPAPASFAGALTATWAPADPAALPNGFVASLALDTIDFSKLRLAVSAGGVSFPEVAAPKQPTVSLRGSAVLTGRFRHGFALLDVHEASGTADGVATTSFVEAGPLPIELQVDSDGGRLQSVSYSPDLLVP